MLKAASAKKQILLVDDDRSVTDMLSLLFETRGYDVHIACSGKEALKKADRSTDLILLDIMLPDHEGFEICRRLKENKKTSQTAIIILTGKLMTKDIIEGLYLGADDYLTKPFEYEELVARMEAVMRRRQTNDPQSRITIKEHDIVFELRQIIDDELVVPYFQPIFLLNPIKLFAYEGLSRPQTRSLLCAPDLLFKAALQYGVYQELEILVWKKVLDYAADHLNGMKLFLNCNPYLIEGANFCSIKDLFNSKNINIKNVYLEITERSAISNFKVFYQDLTMYRRCGFNFAVDDVGGGYASLEAIIETRPEVLKIDRHIIHQLRGDELRCSIVKFIVAFCKENGILSVAEGIETQEDFEKVRELGVDAGQGFYFCKPMPRMMSEDAIMKSLNLR